MNKKLGVAGGIVFLVGISAYMWVATSSGNLDAEPTHAPETFSCSQCGNQFAMTTEEAKKQLQSGPHAYLCSSCAALRNNNAPPLEQGQNGEEKKKKPPRPGLGMQPIQP